ncbi:transposase [Corallococcus sp. CA053C]|uniref:transposase n=1 Tax=Corallococcus sp. CA053C TaxID=2316732 RepID=UPI000EA1F3B1|nr:transposase [Corallococcus sp. CA053C]RKH09342.1 transposase [Corallococcus sp. CA053C]
MSRELVPSTFGRVLRRCYLPPQPKKKLGRPWTDDRAALETIVFGLRRDIPWEMLPRKQFGMTAWRRLKDWTRAGVWGKL